MNSRKINTPGINPSSYLVHPATLKFIKKNQDKDKITIDKNKNKNKSESLLIPKIHFSYETILSSFNIKYIKDLDDNLDNFGKFNKIRLIDIYFKYNKDLKNYTKNDIDNIYLFLSQEFNLSNKQIYNNLTSLKNKSFEDIFY